MLNANEVVSSGKNTAWKRAWIPLIGWILAGGFVNNLLLHPFFKITLVDYWGLISTLAVMIAFSAGRDYLLKKASSKHLKNTTNKGWKRNWIPVIGYVLAAGFAINCLVAPYVDLVTNTWPELVATLGTLLGVSGIRDVAITPKLSELSQLLKEEGDDNQGDVPAISSEEKIDQGAEKPS